MALRKIVQVRIVELDATNSSGFGCFNFPLKGVRPVPAQRDRGYCEFVIHPAQS